MIWLSDDIPIELWESFRGGPDFYDVNWQEKSDAPDILLSRIRR